MANLGHWTARSVLSIGTMALVLGTGSESAGALERLVLPIVPDGSTGAPEKGDFLRPISLASGDLDRDGTMDLVVGYATPRSGALALYHGNPGAFVPTSAAASRLPFLQRIDRLQVPVQPDFLAAGDFNADDREDVLVAARDGDAVYLLPGRSDEGFGSAERFELPGSLKTLAVGEINRADGLEDLIVAIVGPEGPRVLVFESPRGALRDAPEILRLPGEPTALAIGQMDEGFAFDLAVATTSELVVFQGRDRRLAFGEKDRREVRSPSVRRLSLPFRSAGLVAGDFVPDAAGRKDLALLTDEGTLHVIALSAPTSHPVETMKIAWSANLGVEGARSRYGTLVRAKLSSRSAEDLVTLDPDTRQVIVLTPVAGETPGVGRVVQRLEGAPVAVLPMRLNEDALGDLVVLREGSLAPEVLLSTSASTFTVNQSGDQPDGNPGDGICNAAAVGCTLRAAIMEANASPGADTIDFALGSGSPGIFVSTSLPTITETLTLLGDTGGATRVWVGCSSGFCGAAIDLGPGSDGCAVRSLVINGGFNSGILIRSSGNVVENCFLGPDTAGGHTGFPNCIGVRIDSGTGNRIGGTTPAQRNVITAGCFGGPGVSIASSENSVQGNYIGTDVSGTIRGFAGTGVAVSDTAQDNLIGGATSTPGNPPGNLISGLRDSGIKMSGSGNLIQGNLIGTTPTGLAALSNGLYGVETSVTSNGNTIGSSTLARRNVISGNTLDGILVQGVQNIVSGNHIGTNISGGNPLANAGGIRVTTAQGNLIGGYAPLAGLPPGNVISGNSGFGVQLEATSNQVLGNEIGNLGVANSVGVRVTSSSNEIGGTIALTPGSCTGACNAIRSNQGAGVRVSGSNAAGNAIRGNSIVSNSGLGIDLDPAGVTSNDTQDLDTGPNGLQNFPVLESWSSPPMGPSTVTGHLESTPNTTFAIDVFQSSSADPSGFGEGANWVGTATCTTDGSGQAAFSVPVALGPSPILLTATATDPAGNTSEFSQVFSYPDEASRNGDMQARRGAGSTVIVSYTPACGATDHAIYIGATPIAGALDWTRSACGLGASGNATFDPGTPPSGAVYYFVIVGLNPTREGSYGVDSNNTQRPEAIGVGACDRPQSLALGCP